MKGRGINTALRKTRKKSSANLKFKATALPASIFTFRKLGRTCFWRVLDHRATFLDVCGLFGVSERTADA